MTSAAWNWKRYTKKYAAQANLNYEVKMLKIDISHIFAKLLLPLLFIIGLLLTLYINYWQVQNTQSLLECINAVNTIKNASMILFTTLWVLFSHRDTWPKFMVVSGQPLHFFSLQKKLSIKWGTCVKTVAWSSPTALCIGSSSPA